MAARVLENMIKMIRDYIEHGMKVPVIYTFVVFISEHRWPKKYMTLYPSAGYGKDVYNDSVFRMMVPDSCLFVLSPKDCRSDDELRKFGELSPVLYACRHGVKGLSEVEELDPMMYSMSADAEAIIRDGLGIEFERKEGEKTMTVINLTEERAKRRYEIGWERGFALGKAEALAACRAEGREEGKTTGEIEAFASAVSSLMSAQGISKQKAYEIFGLDDSMRREVDTLLGDKV